MSHQVFAQLKAVQMVVDMSILVLISQSENYPSSSGDRLRFKHMVAKRRFDLHTIMMAYPGRSTLTNIQA